jgi:hypothetical protein
MASFSMDGGRRCRDVEAECGGHDWTQPIGDSGLFLGVASLSSPLDVLACVRITLLTSRRRTCDPHHNRPHPVLYLPPLSGMPIREFHDDAGARWTVWNTIPFAGAGVVEPMRTGWLTFESSGIRKRLMPIPDGWETASDATLSDLCAHAETVGRTPHTGSIGIQKRDA